ncbi:MAG: hypothetical protein HQL23_07300 [Candidatus Omnitrophica bacterium]|nr:hypothetical protein [Candidatus Omnitrophota bacterium]
MPTDLISILGLIAAVVMPLFNIPLIMRVIQRRSSSDISMWWAAGVWGCIILMTPAGLRSNDMVWRVFNIMNVIFFTMVFVVTMKYRKGTVLRA